jgi:thiol:disulfide interchange protein DsbD
VAGERLLEAGALGLGAPFFLVGTFAVSLPKGGSWMLAVKWFFGVALALLASSPKSAPEVLHRISAGFGAR